MPKIPISCVTIVSAFLVLQVQTEITQNVASTQTDSAHLHSQDHDISNNVIDYDTLDEEKRSWKDLSGSGWGKRSWKDLSGSGWGKRGWQDLQTSGWGKRGWQDLQTSGWGKRGWQNLQSSGWGKRAWKNLPNSGWGKRGWKDLKQNSWGKRDQTDVDNNSDYLELDGIEDSLDEVKRSWNAMRGPWGKRDAKDWASMKGAWGKRDPAWHSLKGLWGKRSTDNYRDTNSQYLQDLSLQKILQAGE